MPARLHKRSIPLLRSLMGKGIPRARIGAFRRGDADPAASRRLCRATRLASAADSLATPRAGPGSRWQLHARGCWPIACSTSAPHKSLGQPSRARRDRGRGRRRSTPPSGDPLLVALADRFPNGRSWQRRACASAGPHDRCPDLVSRRPGSAVGIDAERCPSWPTSIIGMDESLALTRPWRDLPRVRGRECGAGSG